MVDLVPSVFADHRSWVWMGVWGGLLGLLSGSYLATVFVRWPSGLSANVGRSRCDGCARPLQWFELMPVVSWAAMRGRCRSCKHQIDPSHLAIELLCGLAGASAFALGQPIVAPVLWLFIALAFFDGAYFWLPDRLVAPLACAAVLAPTPIEGTPAVMRLAGGAVGFLALRLIGDVFRRATGRVGLGGGDAKLFGAIGLWVGILQLPVVMILACTIGFGDAGRRLLRRKMDRPTHLPLGAYLCIAAIWFGALASSVEALRETFR